MPRKCLSCASAWTEYLVVINVDISEILECSTKCLGIILLEVTAASPLECMRESGLIIR
jgi:hypothetical protein